MNALMQTLENLDLAHWSSAGLATLRVIAIALAAWIAVGLVQRLIRLFRARITRGIDDPEVLKRAQTLGQVFRYVAVVVILVIAATLILGELGIAVAPILGAAGVVGLAAGFGAQSLVKDYFTGFFILLENQMRQGDVVEIAGKSGMVEEITLRYVRLRDYDGNVHYVANSLITTVTNMSRGFAHAVIDVSVAYREDLDEVFAVMRKVGAELRSDATFGSKILGDLEIAGVERWADSAVVVRCRFETRPLEQWNVKREYLLRLKKAFDARDIEIPFPHLTVYAGAGKRAPAAPFHVHTSKGSE